MTGMPPAPGGGYLPYGTSMSDPRAPWNAPEAGEWDVDEMIEFVLDEYLDDIIYEDELAEGVVVWKVEDTAGEYRTFRTVHDCVAFIIFERELAISEAMDEREQERMTDAAYDFEAGEHDRA